MPGKNAKKATDVLNKIAGSTDADTKLVRMFFDEVRLIAKSEIGRDLQRLVGPTDIANAALKSALSEVKKKGDQEWSTDRFRRLARKIAKNKVRDVAREQGRQKRDGGVQWALEGTETSATSDPGERLAAIPASLCKAGLELSENVRYRHRHRKPYSSLIIFTIAASNAAVTSFRTS